MHDAPDPDLERLGDHLAAAAARALAARARRQLRARRVAVTAATVAVAFAALATIGPSPLGPGERPALGELLARLGPDEASALSRACDQPGGLRLSRPRPNGPRVFHLESGRGGQTSQTTTPIRCSSKPVARPGLSPYPLRLDR